MVFCVLGVSDFFFFLKLHMLEAHQYVRISGQISHLLFFCLFVVCLLLWFFFFFFPLTRSLLFQRMGKGFGERCDFTGSARPKAPLVTD